MLSVSDDALFAQWDLKTMERVRVVRSDNDRAFKSCDFDSSATMAVTASHDGVVSLWDMRARRKARDIVQHAGPATSSVFGADLTTIVSCGWDKTIIISDSRKEKTSKELLGHEDWILSVALSSDGQTVISGGWDKTVCIWNVATGSLRTKITDGHTHTVTGVAISPDNRVLASSSYDGTVKLWAANGKVDKLLVGHHGHVNHVIFTPKADNAVVTVGSDHTARLWDISKGELRNEFVCQGPATAVHTVRVQNRLFLAIGDSIGNLYLTKHQTNN